MKGRVLVNRTPYVKVLAASVDTLLWLADRMDSQSDRDEDLILSGVVRDSALKIRRAIEVYREGALDGALDEEDESFDDALLEDTERTH